MAQILLLQYRMNTLDQILQARYDRKVRELSSDLADLVRTGDLTTLEANEWMVAKQEQWMGCDA